MKSPLSPRLKRSALLLALAFPTVAAFAQSSNAPVLGDVVVSASGFEQDIKNAPATITVITREELESRRINSITDALADIEGVDTGSGAGKTGGMTIRMRGLDDDYTLVLIDGRRQNSTGNIYPNGFGEARNSFLPPVSAIERIEIIRGPMSTLYGSDAMGGVVNIITRKVSDTWTGSATIEGTMQEHSEYGDSYAGDVYLSGPLKQDLLGLQVRARNWHREQSHIAYDFDDGSEGAELTQGRNPTKSRIESYGARLTLTPNKSHDIWLDIESTKQTYDNSKEQLGTLGAAGGYEDTQRYNRDKLLLAHTWRMDSGLLESSLSYNETETIGRLIPARLIGRSGDRGLKSKDFIFDTKYVTAIANHMLTLGAQYWDAEMTDGILPQSTSFTQIGLFAEDEWRLRDDLALTLGLRHDYHDEFGHFTTPRAYLVWNTSPQWTLKGGISSGYKAPRLEYLTNGIYTVGGQGRSPQIGNPDLKPETSVNTEFGVIYDSLTGFTAGTTLFHSKYKDFISTSAGPITLTCATNVNEAECEDFLASFGSNWDMGYRNYPLATGAADTFTLRRPVNVDEARIQGVELFSRWKFASNWSVSGNYTYTDSKQLNGASKGKPINDTPKHMVNLSLRWKATDKLSAWVSGEYRGEGYRSGTHTASGTAAALNGRATRDLVGDWKGYSLFNLGTSYKVSKNLTVNGTIYNLFDKQFNEAKLVPNTSTSSTVYATYRNNLEPRRLWVSASLNF